MSYVPLEAFVEHGMENSRVGEVGFKCEILEDFSILSDRGGLFQAGEKPSASLLLRVHVSPFQ
jgi:hypothetical protein